MRPTLTLSLVALAACGPRLGVEVTESGGGTTSGETYGETGGLSMGAVASASSSGESSHAPDGSDTSTDRGEPEPEPWPPPEPWHVANICAGDRFTCAASVDGRAKCWGDASAETPGYPTRGVLGQGQGDESLGDDESVAEIPSFDLGGRVVQVACGSGVACAVLESGELHCWGSNFVGQLGLGHTETIGDDEPVGDASRVPLVDVAAVDAGARHTCAVLFAGTLRCWGLNFNLALGIDLDHQENLGDDEDITSVGAVDLSGAFATVVAAGSTATCAVTGDEQLYCWGGANSIQTGENGLGADWASFGLLPSELGPLDLGAPVQQVDARAAQTCAVAGGQARCWGISAPGASEWAMTGTMTAAQSTPLALGGVVERLWMGKTTLSTCFKLSGGSVVCMGDLSDGKLGYGDGGDQYDPDNPPEPLAFGAQIKELALGKHHSCAALGDGRVLCYGRPDPGVLGRQDDEPYGDDEVPDPADAFAAFTP